MGSRIWRKRIRKVAIASLGGQCAICGSTNKLEFHHKNPDTKISSIAHLIRTNTGLLGAELKKCELLCKKHHILWHQENNVPYGK